MRSHAALRLVYQKPSALLDEQYVAEECQLVEDSTEQSVDYCNPPTKSTNRHLKRTRSHLIAEMTPPSQPSDNPPRLRSKPLSDINHDLSSAPTKPVAKSTGVYMAPFAQERVSSTPDELNIHTNFRNLLTWRVTLAVTCLVKFLLALLSALLFVTLALRSKWTACLVYDLGFPVSCPPATPTESEQTTMFGGAITAAVASAVVYLTSRVMQSHLDELYVSSNTSADMDVSQRLGWSSPYITARIDLHREHLHDMQSAALAGLDFGASVVQHKTKKRRLQYSSRLRNGVSSVYYAVVVTVRQLYARCLGADFNTARQYDVLQGKIPRFGRQIEYVPENIVQVSGYNNLHAAAVAVPQHGPDSATTKPPLLSWLLTSAYTTSRHYYHGGGVPYLIAIAMDINRGDVACMTDTSLHVIMHHINRALLRSYSDVMCDVDDLDERSRHLIVQHLVQLEQLFVATNKLDAHLQFLAAQQVTQEIEAADAEHQQRNAPIQHTKQAQTKPQQPPVSPNPDDKAKSRLVTRISFDHERWEREGQDAVGSSSKGGLGEGEGSSSAREGAVEGEQEAEGQAVDRVQNRAKRATIVMVTGNCVNFCIKVKELSYSWNKEDGQWQRLARVAVNMQEFYNTPKTIQKQLQKYGLELSFSLMTTSVGLFLLTPLVTYAFMFVNDDTIRQDRWYDCQRVCELLGMQPYQGHGMAGVVRSLLGVVITKHSMQCTDRVCVAAVMATGVMYCLYCILFLYVLVQQVKTYNEMDLLEQLDLVLVKMLSRNGAPPSSAGNSPSSRTSSAWWQWWHRKPSLNTHNTDTEQPLLQAEQSDGEGTAAPDMESAQVEPVAQTANDLPVHPPFVRVNEEGGQDYDLTQHNDILCAYVGGLTEHCEYHLNTPEGQEGVRLFDVSQLTDPDAAARGAAERVSQQDEIRPHSTLLYTPLVTLFVGMGNIDDMPRRRAVWLLKEVQGCVSSIRGSIARALPIAEEQLQEMLLTHQVQRLVVLRAMIWDEIVVRARGRVSKQVDE